ncbi:MAG: multiheme c-type cytochrome [Bacteroidota bacterium]
MSSRPVWLLLLCFATSCGPAATADYHVARLPENQRPLAVTLEVRGAPRDSLVLQGYASDAILRVSDLRASGPDGRALPVQAGSEPVPGNETARLPRVVVRGPLPSRVAIRYQVRPGTREGDAHMGFTGKCYGYAGDRFALVTGRDIFLVPQPAEAFGRIRVGFSLPPGWTAVTPWQPEGDRWRTDVGGKLAAEHLISASLGLGRFREHSFQAGGTRFRLAFESSIAPAEERESAGELARAVNYLRARFGRDLGPRYTTVVVPDTPDGDEIVGEAWGTGQGRSLAPLTANRIHDFAADLIGAYTRYAPYRTEIERPDEFWLVDGIAGWYSWRAVAAAGRIGDDEVSRAFAEGYLTSFYASGVEQNLENLYSSTKSTPLSREALAPFVLIHLDHELRSARPGGGFDHVLPALFRGRHAPSLWVTLPGGPAFWRTFRSRIVRGEALAPVESYFGLTPTRPEPVPPAGPIVRRLTIAYTGNSAGFLETCGCKVNQSGGMARRATVLERLRRKDPNLLLLDAGSAFGLPENERQPDFFSGKEQQFYLRLMDSMGYGAAAVGTNELAFGIPYFEGMVHEVKTHYLAANLLRGGAPVAPADTLLQSGGLRVAVVGLFEPPRASATSGFFEESTTGLIIQDPIRTLQRGLPAWRRGADLAVVMGRLSPTTIRRMIAECPGIDVILSTDDDAPARRRVGGRVELHNQDASGFVGRTLVLYTPLRNYGLSSAELGLDAGGRIAAASIDDHWLRKDVPDDRDVRRRLDRFYDEVGRLDAAQASVTPPFADDPARVRGAYVGASRCAECHESEYAQWKTTKHASAYKTLLDAHRHYQPRCVSCHVVGFGSPTGYRVGAPEEPLGNVQCEVCHGPGAAHAADPSRTNTRRAVPATVCAECHTPDHSDHFVYAEQLPKVRHDHVEGPAAPAALAAGSR